MPLIIWNWFRQRLTPASTMSDVALVLGLSNELVDISRVICLVQAQMLFDGWAGNDDGEDEIVDGPFIMLVGAGDINGQWGPSFVNQDMHLGPALASVCWITPCRRATQWRGNRLAVDSLPFPAHAFLASIEADQTSHDLLPKALLLPGLEALMQHATGDAKPLSMNRFPLTTSPQHVPDAIDDSPVVGPRSTWSRLLCWFGQMSFDAPPQRAWNAEVIDILWLCVTLYLADDAPRETFVLSKDNSLRSASFFHVSRFFG